MKSWKMVLFISILLVGIVVRFYKLGEIPEGLHADEAAFGYNAYSILETGKDEYGKPYPIILKSFGDYKGAIYSYMAIPFIKLYGLNEWSVRAPSAIFGVLWIILIYKVIAIYTKRSDIAFLVMGLSAISPLPVLLSRTQSDPMLSIFFVVSGLYFFFLWMEKKRNMYIFASLVFWTVSLLTNTLPRLFLIVFLPFLLFWFLPVLSSIQKKITIMSISVIFIGIGLLSFGSQARLDQISVFNKTDVKLLLDEKIREDGVGKAPLIITRVYHNKVIDYGRYLVKNYFQYFSFNFLFYQSEQPLREMIPDMGVLYLVELPFLIYGIYVICVRKYRWGYFFIIWLVVVPMLLSFAKDETPNIHRFFLASIPLHVMTAVGLTELFSAINQKKRVIFICLIAFLFFINIYYFFHQLFIHQPNHFPFNRDYAYKPLVSALKKYYPSYEKIIFTKGYGSPYIHILFYGPYDPVQYQNLGSPRDLDETGFDKYFFVPHACPSLSKKYYSLGVGKKTLFIDKSECPVKSEYIIETIYWSEGTAAFYLVDPKYSEEEIMKLK